MLPVRIGKGFLIASIPTPIDARGEFSIESLRKLVSALRLPGVQGIAVGALHGRGSQVTTVKIGPLLETCRAELREDQLLIASIGTPSEIRRPPEILGAARDLASLAASSGANALIAQPPASVRGRPDRDQVVLEYHSALAEVGLPILVSYRRETSGGIAYGPDVLAQLLARPEILGVEIATIDLVSTFQQVQSLAKEFAPDKLVVSGEERFLGYSLMCGADAAIVGIGAAYPSLVGDLLESYFSGDAARFLNRSAEVDALARPIFRAPMDQSSARLLRAMVELGAIP